MDFQCNWPLTKRGLFSEILVYSYFQAILKYRNRELRLISSIRQIRYWRKLFPGLRVSISMLPSSLLLRVSQNQSYMNKFSCDRNLQYHVLDPNIIFSTLWHRESEDFFSSQFNLYDRVAENLEFILSHSPDYDIRKAHLMNTDEPFNAVHIRRGDKIYNKKPEANIVPLDIYINNIVNLFNVASPVYLLGDSVDILTILQSKLITLGFTRVVISASTIPISSKGYNQQLFNKLSLTDRLKYNRFFLQDFATMVRANKLLCSFSSCVGRCAALLRGFQRTYSIDTSFSIVQ